MSREIGHQLRQARESLGLTLADVARRTNIQIKYIIAIEKGEWERLPNIIYARAYVKTYAKLVGVNVHFSQMTRRRPVHESMYTTQPHRDLSYYTQLRQNTRRLRRVQGEVIDKTEMDAAQEEDRTANTESPPVPKKSLSSEENKTVEEEDTTYTSFPSRREKENAARSKKEGSDGRFYRWYDRILIISGILLIIGFSIFFIIKSISPPGLASA